MKLFILPLTVLLSTCPVLITVPTFAAEKLVPGSDEGRQPEDRYSDKDKSNEEKGVILRTQDDDDGERKAEKKDESPIDDESELDRKDDKGGTSSDSLVPGKE